MAWVRCGVMMIFQGSGGMQIQHCGQLYPDGPLCSDRIFQQDTHWKSMTKTTKNQPPKKPQPQWNESNIASVVLPESLCKRFG